MSQQCCSHIRLAASETSQYKVVAFETKDGIKCLDVRLQHYSFQSQNSRPTVFNVRYLARSYVHVTTTYK